MAKMTLRNLKLLFPIWDPTVGGIDHRHTKATTKRHIHKHNPTWLPPTRQALTHAWYRRHKKTIPTRRRKWR